MVMTATPRRTFSVLALEDRCVPDATIATPDAVKPAEKPAERQTGVVDTGDETDDGWPRGHGGF